MANKTIGRDLIAEAVQSVKTLMSQNDWKRQSKVAAYLEINSAFIYYLLTQNTLRPTLYHALVKKGALRPIPPTIEIDVATAAIIFSVAKFPKPRKPKTVPQKKRAPRISIQKENPELAAQAIRKHMAPDHLARLINELSKDRMMVN